MERMFWRANAAQAAVSILFGSSSVINTVGVNAHGVHPVMFGWLRVSIAAVVLHLVVGISGFVQSKVGWLPASGCAASWVFSAADSPSCRRMSMPSFREPRLREMLERDGYLLAVMCAAQFGSQLCHILGLALSGPITTSLWQPLQPVMTVLLATIAGREQLTRMRCIGVGLSTFGCFMMIAHAHTLGDYSEHIAAIRGGRLLGKVCLTVSCLCWSVYLLLLKPMLQRGYSPFSLAQANMSISAGMFAIATAVARFVAWGSLCKVAGGGSHALCAGFWVPSQAWGPAMYMGVVATAAPFVLQFFASGVLSASLVSSYSVLQPLAAMLAGYAVIVGTDHPHHGVQDPQVADFWGLSVLLGLFVILREETSRAPAEDFGETLALHLQREVPVQERNSEP